VTQKQDAKALLAEIVGGKKNTAQILKLSAKDAPRFIKLAAACAKAEDFATAQAAAEVAAQCDPKQFDAWVLVGMTRAKQKCYGDAVDPYVKAIELRPQDVSCWTALGELFIGLNDYQRAAASLKQALLLDPEAKHRSGRRARALIGRAIAKMRS
jgi:cytochrome c-type biogenesis protein CcmH/NrfG